MGKPEMRGQMSWPREGRHCEESSWRGSGGRWALERRWATTGRTGSLSPSDHLDGWKDYDNYYMNDTSTALLPRRSFSLTILLLPYGTTTAGII